MARNSNRKRSAQSPRLQRTPKPTARPQFVRRRMWFEALEERVMLDSDLSAQVQNVIRSGVSNAGVLVDGLHDRLFDRVLHRDQPLIGNALQVKDTADDKLNALSARVQSALQTLVTDTEITPADVQNALTTSLNTLIPTGALQSFTILHTLASPDEVRYAISLTGTIVDRTVPFNLGLHSVFTSLSGEIHVGLEYSAQIVLGFSSTAGVFLDTSAADDFALAFEVTSPGLDLGLRMGILRFQAQNNTTGPATGLQAQFKVQLANDTQLTVSELAGLGITANLEGNAVVNLKLTTDLGSANLPSLSTSLLINWQINESSDVALSAWGDAPTVSFGGIAVDAGSFINNLVRPVFDELDKALTPVKPVLDVLAARMPVLSDIAGEDVTLADVIADLSDGNLDIIQAVTDFYAIYESIQSIAFSGNVMLGSFDIGSGVDVRSLSTLSNLTSANLNVTQPGAVNDHAEVAAFLDSTNVDSFDGGFVFPLLEQPGKVFDLLLGKDIEFFRLDLPVLTAGFEFSLPQIPIFPPLGIKISGRFDIGANLGFGYDSSGLRRWSQTNFAAQDIEEVFDGFFVRDRVNGVDNPELFVQARIQAAADVSVGIASVGVGGAIIATIGLDVRDRNTDGRVHPSEIALNISELGPLCGLFQHTGSIDAALTAYVEAGIGPFSVGYSYDIMSVRLVDFEFPCTPGGTPTLAAYDPATGQLTLNTGPRAALRYADIPEILRPAEPDMDEHYLIRKIGENEVTGADIIEIKAFGYTEVYGHEPTSAGVTSIIGDGGKGNDILQLSQSITAVANLSGGTGNDKVIGGSGGGVLYGDGGTAGGPDGDDEVGGYGGVYQIFGGGGNDLLHGGGAADVISGGDGNDTIFGNGSDDNISGNAGDDLVIGGIGNDTLSGDGGNDDVRGEDGNDTIYGFAGNDILRGGEGDNLVFGGVGDDLIHTLGGVDTIYGEAGLDKILAGGGHDLIYGGGDADEISGEDGDDQIFGDAGNDMIFADAGSDTVHGGDDHDQIHGGDHHDFLYGDAGNDSIDGDAGDDDIYGNTGVDTLHGNSGRDRIWGGTENDILDGDADSDALYGEQGDDTLSGGDDDDLVDGGIGNDTLSGDLGIDRLYGREGDDTLYGHALIVSDDDNAADYLFGEVGNDTAYGNGGDDVVDGGAGIDNLYGGVGNDSILAGTGIGDHLYGEAGDDNILGSDEGADTDADLLDASYFGDWIDGGSGNDTVNSLGGADYILGGDGDDWINSGFGADWIRGGAGNDYLYAGRGLGERIDGEEGDDTIYGSNEGVDNLSGNAGQDKVYGQGGNDTISGNEGDDHLDGGTGVDIVSGGLGNDTIYGGGGVGDQLFGDEGSDNIYGSEDGADVILGGTGRDSIYGRGGNDSLSGGPDDDIIDGGAGDDTISGDAGNDLLLGGANHDTIYGHSVSGTGDDNSVDYIYGDFGTDRNESGSGRDRLFGQGGNDLIWGEGDDDLIEVGGGTSNQFYYGAGESGTPSDFVTPTPTAAPTVQTVVGITHAAASLPTGIDSQGRWSELAGSGSYNGLSQSPAGAIESSIAITSAGITYTAWVDARHGNFEIYVARHTPGIGWQELPGAAGFSAPAGSASEGGISNTAGSSRRPTIVIGADGQPIVAWTEFNGSTSNIRVSEFDPAASGGAGAWVALGTSLGAGGISGTGAADFATIVNTALGPTVAWLDASSGTTQVYVKRFAAGAWSGLGGAGFASGTGVSQAAASVAEFALATDGTKVAVTWSSPVSGNHQVFLREFSGSAWAALAGSTTGNGLSNLAGNNRAPSTAYHSGTLYVVWQGDNQIRSEIYGKRFSGGAWQNIGDVGFGISATQGAAAQAKLMSGGGQLHLVWADDSIAARTGTQVAILATRWNGTTFVPEFPLDALTPGIAATASVQSLALAVNSIGKPFVSWSSPGQDTSQIFLLANTFAPSGRVFTASPAVSIQSILDAEDLGSGDVILLTAGNLDGFTLLAQDSGVTIIGVPGAVISTQINIQHAADVTLQSVSVNAPIEYAGGTRNAIVRSTLLGPVRMSTTTDAQLIGNLIVGDGIEIIGGVRATIQRNTIVATGSGIRLTTLSASDLVIRQNKIIAGTAGILFAFASGGTISENDIDGTTSGLDIQAAFSGRIDKNDIYGATVGVIYSAAASLSGNKIRNNATGVQANVATQATAFGFVAPPTGSLLPNEIYANTLGVALAGQMQWQNVRGNTTGVQGSGSLVAVDFEHANVIESNGTGVDIAGAIQFNRIARNGVGVAARSDQLIAHNLIYRNTTVGIQISGDTDVRITSNTLHSPIGDLIRVESGAKEVQITNNIFWAEAGYDIYIDNSSQSGYWSDYNMLHASGTGKLVHWSGYDFTDVLDWQEDVAKFDLHSRGRTSVNPTWSEPHFRNMGLDDYRTFDLTAGVRFSNPAIDAGDPLSDLALAAAPPNLLTNGSFENGLTGWTTNVAAGANTGSLAFDGTRFLTAGAAVAGFAEQTVNLLTAGFTAAELDSRNLMATFSGRIRSAEEVLADLGQLTLRFYNGSDGIISETIAEARNTMDRWELVGGRVEVPVGTRYVVLRFDAVRSSGTNSDSYLDAASLRVHDDRITTDIGAAGNTYQESPAAAQFAALPPHIALRYPDLYTDWERSAPHAIRWETYGNTTHRDVRIDLYQDDPDGPTLVTTIAAATPDDGEFVWIPANSGINFGTLGLRIQVQLVGDTIAVDRSTETFAVPENTTDFFVNDRDGSATPGSNRNTGKLANAPKPFVNNVLRIYTVAPTHTIHVAAGNYAMFNPLIIANILGVGDDEGFVMSGPTATGESAVFRHANPSVANAPIIELNDADFVSMDHITTEGGTYGLLVRNDSNNFVGTHLATARAGFDGIRIESTVTGTRLEDINASANGRFGISVNGPIDYILNSDVGFNNSDGISLSSYQNTGLTTRIEGSFIHDNRGHGIVSNLGNAITIGHSDLSLGRGNIVRDNAGSGISTFNNTSVLIVGNTVSGHRTNGQAGIYTGGTVSNNVVFDNYHGIEGSGLRSYNRIYNNTTIGLTVWGGSSATGNVVYGNKTGIYANNGGTTLANNLVYNNTELAINLRGGGLLVNNTIHQTLDEGPGDAAAINLAPQSSGLQLRNNIIWVTVGYGVIVPANSQGGFQSDYNLIYATGDGRIGQWQNVARSTLTEWQNATFGDQNSLSQDPQFVGGNDYHERSQFGSYHGGSLAPILSGGTGLPIVNPGTLTTDGSQSPVIDRGNGVDSYANEPVPNGGFINLGAYGNTSQASLSPAQYVLVMRPDGGETWPAGQSFPIRWRSHNFTGNVKIELLTSAEVVAATPNDGELIWAIPAGFTPGNYRVRVTRLDAGSVSDTSNNLFSIPAPVHLYYVNDSTVVGGDWTTAPGNDANDGLTPNTPKASIRALLEAYDLGAGDTIRVDAGNYTLTQNILVTADDSGVRIEGFHTSTLPVGAELFADDRTLRTVLDRGNTAGGSYIFQFTGADDVTLSHLGMTGAEWAVVGLSGGDSDRITIESSEMYANRNGMYFDSSNEAQRIIGNRIFDNIDAGGVGINIWNPNSVLIDQNAIFDFYYGTGMDLRGSGAGTTSITNNIVYYTTTGIAAGSNASATIIVSGNNVHDNRFTGISGGDWVTVVGNTVHDTVTGISARLARNNIVYNSQIGIEANSGTIEGNRVFNNSRVGIATSYGTVQGNTVYSNHVGIRAYGTLITNNLIYDNDNDGIWIYREGTARIENNTIYETGASDAIQLGGAHPEQLIGTGAVTGTIVKNNILHVEQGYALNFAPDSGAGSSINYNSYRVTGTAKLARWLNRDFTSLDDWYLELGFDQNSQTSDPQFIDFNGADNVLGYDTTPVGAPVIIDNAAPGFSSAGAWQHVEQADGAGGDFVENTFINGQTHTATWRFTGSVGYPPSGNLTVTRPVTAFWAAHPGLSTATYTHTTVANYVVTYRDGQGNLFDVAGSQNFSGTVGSINQALGGAETRNLGDLSLTFANIYANPAFVNVTPVTLTTTLRIAGAGDVIADTATIYGTSVDDGDVTFTKESGVWVNPGRDADYHVRPSTERGTASWEFTGLTPGAFYDLAALWTAIPGNSNAAEFTIFDGDLAVRHMYRDLNTVPSDFTDANSVKWNRLGVVKATGDRITVKLSGTGKLQADAVRLQEVVGDQAADDDFHVGPASPSIDAGDPTSVFSNEPTSNGGRINLGHTGNTSGAITSPTQLVQVLSPNGLERYENSQPVSIQWRSNGIPVTSLPNVLLNESPLVYYRFDETTGTVANDSSGNGRNGTYAGGVTLGAASGISELGNVAANFDGSNDEVTVPSPGTFATSQLTIESWVKPDATMPTYGTVAMKSTSSSWNDGYGLYWNAGKLRFFVNHYNSSGTFVEATVPTGVWSHVAATYDGAVLKLYVNGVLFGTSNYSTPINHSAQALQVGRGAGGAYHWKGGLDEVAIYGTALNAGQVNSHYLRSSLGNANVELIHEATSAVTVLAAATPNDGEFTWTIPANLPGGQYRVRITASAGIAPSDVSDASFLVANSGNHYYVNDSSLAGDVFTTAVGDNANDGKSSAKPMASIAALLAAYDLDAGDVIHVDAGTYNLLRNIVIDANDAGVKIEGPGAVGGTSAAVFNRGSAISGAYVFEIKGGADDVTLDHLSLTGSGEGVVVAQYSDSDRIALTNLKIYDNARLGIYVGNLNDNAHIEDSLLYNNRTGGIYAESNTGIQVIDNVLHHNSNPGFGGTGIAVVISNTVGSTSRIEGNETYNNDVGISVSGSNAIEVRNNLVHHNYSGIAANGNALVIGNTVHTNQGYHWSIGYGIAITHSTAIDNIVYDNDRGIDMSGGTARGNRIYHNRDIGIQGGANAATMVGNFIYGNSLGIKAGGGDSVLNNLIYDNPGDGIWVSSSGVRIENNTIYQSAAGDAVQIGAVHPIGGNPSGAGNTTIKNNILRVGQGYAINVAADSEAGFASDYNDFVITGTGKMVRWEDRDFTSREDWFYQLGYDAHSIVADPQFIDVDGADNKLGYETATSTNYGNDDNFRVEVGSPTIDAGDPSSSVGAEPTPNGGRVNIGHTGATADAATSPAQLVQVLSPNGLEKLEQGQSVSIDWRTAGIAPVNQYSSGILSDNPFAYYRLGDTGTTAVNSAPGGANATYVGAFQQNVIGALNYDVNGAAQFNGGHLQLPSGFADFTGGFSAEMWVNPSSVNNWARMFDIGNGQQSDNIGFARVGLSNDVQFFVVSGTTTVGVVIATGVLELNQWQHFAVTVSAAGAVTIYKNGVAVATGTTGLPRNITRTSNYLGKSNWPDALYAGRIDEAAFYNRALTGQDIIDHYNNRTYGDVKIELERVGSGERQTLATAAPNTGSYQWTIPANLPEGQYRIRVTSNQGSFVSDSSDTPLFVVNGGNHYYINDNLTTNDLFTTAVGNDANSGKSPDQPMASLNALIAAYDLDPGDAVHIDTGTYRVYENLRLEASDSGVRFEGPGATPTGQVLGATATITRGNSLGSQAVFEFAGADDVTIDYLHITGANVGIWAPNGAQSERITISNNNVFSNGGSNAAGIAIGQSNREVRILNNKVFNNNQTSGSGIGIFTAAPKALVESNESYGQQYGIYSDYTGNSVSADAAVIRNNIARNNTSVGIRGYQDDQIVGNTVFGHTGVNAAGIDTLGSDVLNNTVYGNYNGVLTAISWFGEARGNRIYGNTNVGIWARGSSPIVGNQFFNNGVGIYVNTFNATISSNIVYSNTNQGMLVESSSGTTLVNNTVYQAVGDAIRLRGNNNGNIRLRNNIVWIDSGYAINVDGGSQGGFSSDYNLLYQSTDPNAHVGFWGGVVRDSLAEWQAANSQDANSVTSDPLFVDRDGSDNVFGYRSSDGYDGGRDDNFFLRAGSPAIDRGDGAIAPALDLIGASRFDDPGTPNAGIPAGLPYVDLGAYEFRGSSLDVSPPVVTGSSPAGVHAATSSAPLSQFTLSFNEPLNSVDASAPANFELRNAGVNGLIGDSDDVIIPLTLNYTPGSTSLQITIASELPAHTYRFTIFGSGGRGLHDLAGVLFDGDNSGSAGGDYLRTFILQSIVGDYNRDNGVDSQDYEFWKQHFGATSGMGMQADGNGNGVVDAADYTIWRDALAANGAGGAANSGTEAGAASEVEGPASAIGVTSEQSLLAASDDSSLESAPLVSTYPWHPKVSGATLGGELCDPIFVSSPAEAPQDYQFLVRLHAAQEGESTLVSAAGVFASASVRRDHSHLTSTTSGISSITSIDDAELDLIAVLESVQAHPASRQGDRDFSLMHRKWNTPEQEELVAKFLLDDEILSADDIGSAAVDDAFALFMQ